MGCGGWLVFKMQWVARMVCRSHWWLGLWVMVGGWLVDFGLLLLFFLLLQFVDLSGQWSFGVVVGLCGSSGGLGGWWIGFC